MASAWLIFSQLSHKEVSLLLIGVRRSACSRATSASHGNNSCYLPDICTQSHGHGKTVDCRLVEFVRFTACHNMDGQCSVRLQLSDTDRH